MDQVARVREKIDIVSFISEYLTLKKSGRNFSAPCPFHNEKTPSFIISPERQIWHCFGCGKGGDIFSFLMEYEKIEFLEALRSLAKRVGIEIKTGDFATSSIKEKIYQVNKIASGFYQYILTEHRAGEKALSYLLEKRKMNKALIKSFGLGYSPSNNALAAYLINKKKYKKQDLSDAGLIFQRGNDAFDFFRGRLIFPLTDHRGNILGFSGRVLDDHDSPKYINTKETPVYHKGSTFFGIDRALDEIKKAGEAVLMEGEFDVISSFREGIKNAVAIKGTALTDEQSIFLSRFAQKIILCLDQDEAGIEATKRSLAVLEKKNLTSYVASMPGNKDPDDALNSDPVLFKSALKESAGAYDFLITEALDRNSVKTFEGKKKISESLLPAFSLISNEVVKEHYLRKLSSEIDTSLDSLKKQLDKIDKKPEDKTAESSQTDKRGKREIREEYLLSLIVQSEKPKESFDAVLLILEDYEFETEVYKKVMERLILFFKTNNDFESKNFVKNLPKELVEAFDQIFLFPIPKFETKDPFLIDLKRTAKDLRAIYLKNKIQDLSDRLKKVKEKEDPKAEDTLKTEISEITSKLTTL
ncbi:MAG: DNA primase [Candidatus Levybacteria bacterium RIFOXYA1_FULL_41_10]|nr:MAG: primase protein [Candidatus Levybacteria bacterium GW2011_GWA1_39_32]KKR51514.1 MAG: primase protein [Candidatus Levybacteria bacterium GW2011_GWC1_40_19]KKR73530.1 MAG: primase protein [Candidatus Levybacteria bacterium GW2011_GWC2_40_7]KKS01906.1 MAG: primase protein [Candidatus Levybacteria bacterium GW2011_GWB1_41_21]OGH20910.1 MAG: DNA primase [Candidatus Levybacteria bacterium RIFCSPHIGHO2_01_FULL_40_83]OGH25970.1 MAG: DNA primase [Candidatus Levybacteria bacterium RIFCSPHIGHO2_0